MATVGRFEDLEVWKSARILANRIYDLTDGAAFSKDFGLKDQIRRAAVSVLSNIAEGFDRETDADFRHFLSIARGSASEVRAQLYVALDRRYIDETSFRESAGQCQGLSRKISNFIQYLKQSRRERSERTAAAGGQTPRSGRRERSERTEP